MTTNFGKYITQDKINLDLVFATQDNITQRHVLQLQYNLNYNDFYYGFIHKVFRLYQFDGPNGTFEKAVSLYNSHQYLAYATIARSSSPTNVTDFVTQIYAPNLEHYAVLKYNPRVQKLYAEIWSKFTQPAGVCNYFLAFKHPYITNYGVSFESKVSKSRTDQFTATYSINDLNMLQYDGKGWLFRPISQQDATSFFKYFPQSPIVTVNCYVAVPGQANKVQIATHYVVKDISTL